MSEMVVCLFRIVEDPEHEIQDRLVRLRQIPVQGESVCLDEEWYEIKRIVHQIDDRQTDAILYSVRTVDPTKDPLGFLEWINQ